jgi:hypothetical protein
MTEHLPECWAKYPSDPPAWCICDELRACEHRITAVAVQRVEALNFWEEHVREFVHRDEAIAAIKGDSDA